MIKPNEMQILMLAVSFAPLIIWAYLGIDGRWKKRMGAGLLAILGAYVATVAEGFVAYSFFNAVEHVLYLIAAVCFAAAARMLLLSTQPAGSR